MTSRVKVSDEPLSPSGRLFLRPEMDTIIHCALGVEYAMDVEAVKTTIRNSLMLKHPRFCSLLVHDKNGLEHWRRTEVDLDKHILVVENPAEATNNDGSDIEKIVNDYIAGLSVSCPLSLDKPLWEVHIMWEPPCAVFRFHHALGDGIDLMSILLGSCRKVEDPEAVPILDIGGSRKNRKGSFRKLWFQRGVLMGFLKMVLYTLNILMGFLKVVLYSLFFYLEMVLRSLWVRDRKTVISGGEGVELWPREVVTAHLLIEDMKVVKKAIANATINDVLLGMISAGFSKYLDHRSPNSLKKNQRITGVATVNLRKQLGLEDLTKMIESNSRARKGNKFGIILLPIYYAKDVEPLQHVKRAKATLDLKKKSLEGYFSYKVADLAITLLGCKFVSSFNYRIHSNCSYVISNVVGPKEKLTIAGNPIKYVRVNVTGLPQAVSMHMVSYAGQADMQIVVAKDIIPDPKFFAKCIEDSLLEMKEAALAAVKLGG
ncbi:hypothetical protein GH714_015607 [Hevea brasiliensis]|uniref:Uncharacterized protein n=1 Tax=Hevea brasiliensis TaxID=3981 RepID=A0A6A6LCW7_HEVBR|nr:hypothetical protein GH714_015607 [Hevea brasiliensis]